MHVSDLIVAFVTGCKTPGFIQTTNVASFIEILKRSTGIVFFKKNCGVF
jgi:hypothetical protein